MTACGCDPAMNWGWRPWRLRLSAAAAPSSTRGPAVRARGRGVYARPPSPPFRRAPALCRWQGPGPTTEQWGAAACPWVAAGFSSGGAWAIVAAKRKLPAGFSGAGCGRAGRWMRRPRSLSGRRGGASGPARSTRRRRSQVFPAAATRPRPGRGQGSGWRWPPQTDLVPAALAGRGLADGGPPAGAGQPEQHRDWDLGATASSW